MSTRIFIFRRINASALVAIALLAGSFLLADTAWTSLFNGENLDGWTPKVSGSKLGENPGDIFRVEERSLTVSYDAFEDFGKRFGHIFFEEPFENYRFRLEYRFVGDQADGAPKWAYRNSGIMLHCQTPGEMKVDQNFPKCLEFQFLGAYEDGRKRVTGNALALGNKIDYKGETRTKSVPSNYPAVGLDEWVRAELICRDGSVQQYINGRLVAEYENARTQDNVPMASGYISLQAESHGVQFRNIEIMQLDDVVKDNYSESDGWRPLFNRKDLDAFIIEDGTATYRLEDGVITGTTAIGSPNTFLATTREYADFELVFETKISDQLNSGVQIRSRSRETAEGRFDVGRFWGPQVEVAAGPGASGYIYGEATGRGWLSPEPASDDPALKKHDYFRNGEWNHYRIIAEGARIRTYINGILIADLVDEEIYATHPKGHIGLQVHGIGNKTDLHPMTASWRNLYIREIE